MIIISKFQIDFKIRRILILSYIGTVRETVGESYLVEDSVGNMEEISRDNIISDEDDANNSIQVR